MTAATFTSAVKWGPWVGLSAIGIYPYGTTSPSSQWFRPHQNCKMQLLNTPFCAVCKQTIIEKIHSLVNPVDEYFPDNSTAITPSASAQWFKGIFVKPNPNTLKRTWEVNGNIVDLNKDSTLVDNTMLWQGNNTVVLTVMDTTVLSKDTGHVNLHSYSVFWDINYSMVGIKEIKPKLELSVFPNPASEALRLKYRLLEDSNIGISVMDLNGRTLMEEKTVASIAGDYERSLNVSELKEGNYILALKINNQVITTKFIIIK